MSESDGTIQIKKDTFYKGTIAVLGILLIVSIFTGGFGVGGGTGAVTQTPTGADTTAAEPAWRYDRPAPMRRGPGSRFAS